MVLISLLVNISNLTISEYLADRRFQIENSFRIAEIKVKNEPLAHMILLENGGAGTGFERDGRDGVTFNSAIHFSVSVVLTHPNGTKVYIP